MPHPITVPRLGWSMEEGVFAEWLKAPGDLVRAGDMLFLLEGEKATTEIEAIDSGRLCVPTDAPQPGTTVKVGEVIGFLLAEGENALTTVRVPPTKTAAFATPQTPMRDTPQAKQVHLTTSLTRAETLPVPRAAGPAARRLARELGIDLNAVFSCDPTGRVLCEDVQRTANARSQFANANENMKRPVATPRARRRARELGVVGPCLPG